MYEQNRPGVADRPNRRNHYRVLHVQPDAPFEIIRASYRTLLQKLKLHPDLGGDHWNAALVNAAYQALSDPLRREAYDRQLLAVYDIATLAEGPITPTVRHSRARRDDADDRRNHYRLLQVQADAPLEIIEASYRTLSRKPGRAEALEAAFATLSDAGRRAAYDLELGRRARMPARTRGAWSRRDPVGAPHATTTRMAHAYQPVVTSYCLFCKTPHQIVSPVLGDSACIECGSPLAPPPDVTTEDTRRSLARLRRSEPVGFYAFWPGVRYEGTLVDLSPKGLSLVTAHACAVGDVLKLDTVHLQAVGVVARLVPGKKGATVGVEFRTVGFTSVSGSFISTRV